MPLTSTSASATPLPAQPFFASPSQRVGLARERYFGEGQRPTGLVSESVIQSWARCVGARRSPREAVAFEPVTRSRLSAVLARNEHLLSAASAELERLEAALGGTACRVLLTDADGVIVHATQAPHALEPVLQRAARLGVNIAEDQVGTNAPALVVKTGAPATVLGAEHFFDCIQSLHCVAAPIRDGHGRLAGVLDLTLEARPFAFDAAALVGVYATAIENRLLQVGASNHLVLRFQVCTTMLGSPLQALVGVDSKGHVAWMNSTAQQLLGHGCSQEMSAERLFGTALEQLLACAGRDGASAIRLPNGLSVWVQARRPVHEATRRTVPAASAAVDTSPVPAEAAPPAPAAPTALSTLDQHTREVIERTLAEQRGNISRTARQLGVSRGLLYRRLREWAAPAA
jgi:transcriptional regulator of acetoin/glycerol metabolism